MSGNHEKLVAPLTVDDTTYAIGFEWNNLYARSVVITCNRYIHFFQEEIDDTLRQAVGV